MQVDATHILVVVTVSTTTSVSVVVPMGVPVVMVVSKGCHAHQVNEQPERANNKELAQSLCMCSFPQSLEGLERDFDAKQPAKELALIVVRLSASSLHQ